MGPLDQLNLQPPFNAPTDTIGDNEPLKELNPYASIGTLDRVVVDPADVDPTTPPTVNNDKKADRAQEQYREPTTWVDPETLAPVPSLPPAPVYLPGDTMAAYANNAMGQVGHAYLNNAHHRG